MVTLLIVDVSISCSSSVTQYAHVPGPCSLHGNANDAAGDKPDKGRLRVNAFSGAQSAIDGNTVGNAPHIGLHHLRHQIDKAGLVDPAEFVACLGGIADQ